MIYGITSYIISDHLSKKVYSPVQKTDGDCDRGYLTSSVAVATVTKNKNGRSVLDFASGILKVRIFWGDGNLYLNSFSEDGLGSLNS